MSEMQPHADNAHDAIERGRHSPPPRHEGEGHPRAKLDYDMAREMRRRIRARELTYRLAAHEYGVSESTVCRVMSGESWSD